MSYFTAKIHKIRFRLRLRPRPHWGAYSALSDPLDAFKGPTSKGREGRKEGREAKGRKGEKEREGKAGRELLSVTSQL